MSFVKVKFAKCFNLVISPNISLANISSCTVGAAEALFSPAVATNKCVLERDHCQVDHADGHVEAMKTDDHEERRTELRRTQGVAPLLTINYTVLGCTCTSSE